MSLGGVVTLTSIGRIETNSAAWQLQAATLAADFHSAMALRRWRRVAGAERWERGGTKRLRTAEKTFTNRCRYLGDRKPCIARLHGHHRSEGRDPRIDRGVDVARRHPQVPRVPVLADQRAEPVLHRHVRDVLRHLDMPVIVHP